MSRPLGLDLAGVGEHLDAPLYLLRLEDACDPGSFRVLYANAAAGEAWQAPVEALVGRRLLEAFPGLEGTDLPQFYRDVLAEGRSATIDAFHYRGDVTVPPGVFSFEAFPVGAEELAVVFDRVGSGTTSAWHLRQLSAIVDSSSDAIISKTLGGTITSWNRAAEAMYGYSQEEAVGQSISLIVPDDRRDELEEILAALARGERVSELETVRLVKGGGLIDVQLTVSPVHDDGGRVIGASVIGRDITAAKRAACELAEQQELFRAAFDEAAVAMWLTTPEGRFLRVNQAACDLLGYEREELEALCLHDVTPAYGHASADEAMRALGAGETAHFVTEKQYLRKDGTLVWTEVNASAVRDRSGAPRYFIGQIQNVSSRREAEELLRRSEDLYRVVVENSRDLVALIDLSGRFLFVSTAYDRLLGHAPEQLVGRFARELLDPEDDAAATGWFEAANERPLLVRLAHADGSWLPVEVKAGFVYDGDGAPLGVLAVGRDMTDRVAKEELEKRLRQVERMEAIGQLAGGVAHDFNNLMMVVLGSVEIAEHDLSDAGRIEHSLAQIRHAADDAAQLTRQLLAFGRQQVLQPEVLDLNAVVREYERMLARLIGDDVEISLRLDPTVCAIKADRRQLGQIIVNLGVNARDAMPDGGRLVLATSTTPAGALPEDAAPVEHVRLTITDTGCGIDEAAMERLFEPFFTTKEIGQGTGLGLATVFGVTKQSGGQITVESTVGKGTAFMIDLPAVDAPAAVDDAAAPGEDAPAEPPPAGGQRVLLVEDNEDVREVTAGMLTAHGYAVVGADHPHQALALAAHDRPPFDLLVTDVALPGLDGRELAELLRREWPGLKVIYSSGYAADAAGGSGGAGADTRFLQKPFTAAELVEAARALLSEGDVARHAEATARRN